MYVDTVLKSKVCASVFTNTRPLQPYEDKVSSVSIPGLQENQWYCVMVQYTLFNMSVGPPSCIRCELIPESSKNVYCLFFTRPSTHAHRPGTLTLTLPECFVTFILSTYGRLACPVFCPQLFLLK